MMKLFHDILRLGSIAGLALACAQPASSQESMADILGALGNGDQSSGLNPLYQIGGPRSAQLALKLQF